MKLKLLQASRCLRSCANQCAGPKVLEGPSFIPVAYSSTLYCSAGVLSMVFFMKRHTCKMQVSREARYSGCKLFTTLHLSKVCTSSALRTRVSDSGFISNAGALSMSVLGSQEDPAKRLVTLGGVLAAIVSLY